MRLCDILLTVIIGILSSIIGGIIVIKYINYKERQSWKRVKERYQDEWIKLLNRTFTVLRLLLNIEYRDVFKLDNFEESKKLIVTRIQLLNKYSQFFKENVLANFTPFYETRILNCNSKEWHNFCISLHNLSIQGDVLISRLTGFRSAEPIVLERIFQWIDQINGLETLYATFVPELEKPLNDCNNKDKQAKMLVVKDIEKFINSMIKLTKELNIIQ
jgi:hypothetical protein